MITPIQPKVWLDYDQDALNDQYNQRVLVPNADEYAQRNLEESERVRACLPCELDVPYGPSEAEKLDLFPAPIAGGPIVVYIHGGAWTRSSKNYVSYPAESFTRTGVAYVAVDFSLVPSVTLDEQVRQNRAAIQWVYHHAESYGADPNQLYVAGHSSGAHVTAMMMTTDWARDWGLPPDVIKADVPCKDTDYQIAGCRARRRLPDPRKESMTWIVTVPWHGVTPYPLIDSIRAPAYSHRSS